RRYQRRSRPLLAAGAALLVVSFALGGILGWWCEYRNQRLYAAGRPTDGTVVGLDNDPSMQLFAPRVTVAYHVAGEPNLRRASIRQLAFGGRSYHPGDRVSVVYDPADPARATIVGENNQSLLLSMAVRMPFTLGSYLLGPGLFFYRRGRRLRKRLARADWQI